MYTPQTHPKMYRGGRMTGAAFVRESRRLSHYEDGLYFQGAHKAPEGSPLAERLAEVKAHSAALFAAYKQGR